MLVKLLEHTRFYDSQKPIIIRPRETARNPLANGEFLNKTITFGYRFGYSGSRGPRKPMEPLRTPLRKPLRRWLITRPEYITRGAGGISTKK